METHVTAKGQIVIPAILRKKYVIRAGMPIQIFEENDHIVLQPITREYIHKLRGKHRGQGLMEELMAEKKREWEL